MASANDVVIIGAPRSGTNMLRDVLTALPGLSTWPCDEINYVWRYGHAHYPSDELAPDMVTDASRRYIRRAFARVRRRSDARVVEKTCANSLRVPFVEAVLDRPTYLFIVRDGLDAVASARLRWTADLDLRYLAQKARYVPSRDLPIYAGKYASARMRRLVSSERALPSWGPRLHDMDELVASRDLNEVCAIQWQRCVDAATRDLGSIDQERVVRVRYEDYVRDPVRSTAEIVNKLGMSVDEEQLRHVTARVSSASVGKGRGQLGLSEAGRLAEIIRNTQEVHGYVG